MRSTTQPWKRVYEIMYNSFLQFLTSAYYQSDILRRPGNNKVKRRISKGVFQENKARQIFRKTNISYPLIRTCTCVYQGVRNISFLENLTCSVFLKHAFWDSLFCLINDEFWNYTALAFHWNFAVHSHVAITTTILTAGQSNQDISKWNCHNFI